MKKLNSRAAAALADLVRRLGEVGATLVEGDWLGPDYRGLDDGVARSLENELKMMFRASGTRPVRGLEYFDGSHLAEIVQVARLRLGSAL